MSTLTDAFKARYSATRVRALTLADNQDSDTADSTRLGLAATDAADEFETLCGVAFDETSTAHIRVAVLLMEAILLEWGTGTTSESKAVRTRAEERAAALRDITGRNRPLPSSGTRETGSEEPFTAEIMERYRIRPPGWTRDVDGCGRC